MFLQAENTFWQCGARAFRPSSVTPQWDSSVGDGRTRCATARVIAGEASFWLMGRLPFAFMNGLIGGRTASDIPGLDIAEQKSWENFLAAAIHVYAALNGRLVDAHRLSLGDVNLLQILSNSPDGSARMGDLATALPSPPTRVTRRIRRLETQELVRRDVSPDDRRGVIATITDKGRMVVDQAMVTYAREVRKVFLAQMSQAQVTAMEDRCRRIAKAVKQSEASANLIHLAPRRPRRPGALRGPTP